MRRLGYILAALLALGRGARADQGWSDNQDGQNFACFNVDSFSANNLSGGGATFSTPVTGTIVNSYPSWWSQLAWFIDPQNSSGHASDSNSGATNVTPLLTWAEMARRWDGAVLSGSYTINVMSDGNASDAVVMNVQFAGGVSTAVLVLGVPTAIYSGTITTFTAAGAGPAADDYEITDSTLPTSFTASGLLADGVIAERTNGTARWWYFAKDLGSKTARISVPCSNGGAGSTLSNGDSYSALRLPKVYGVQWPNMLGMSTSFGQVIYDRIYDFAPTLNWQQATYERVWRGTTTDTDIGMSLSNVGIGTGLTTNIRQGRALSVLDFGLVRTNIFVESGPVIIAGTVFEGGIVQLQRGSELVATSRFDVDDVASPMLLVLTGSTATFTGSGNMSGVGNTGNLINVASGGRVIYDNTPVAATSTSGTQISVNGTGYAVSALPVSDPNSGSGVRKTTAPSYSAGCAQFTTSGILSSTGSSCGSGSGSVTSVTGTAQRISVVNPTTTPVVDTIGGFYSGAISGGNEDLGTALTNGLVCDTTTAGVAVLSTCTAGTDYQAPMSAADGTVVFPTATTIRRAAITGDATIAAGSNGSKVVALTDSGAVSHPIGSMTNSQCMALDGSGNVITQACASGSGTVTSVTGTAGQILCTPTSPNPVCSLIAAGSAGSCTNCSVTFDALGRETAQSSGTAPVTSIGVTAPITTTGGTTPTIGITGGANQVQVGTGSNVGGFTDFVYTDSPLAISVGSATPPTGYIGNFELNTNGAATIGVHNPNAGTGAQASLCAWQAAGSASPFTLPIFCLYQLGHGWTGAYGADAFAIEGYGGSSFSRTGPMYLRNYFGDVFLSAGSSGNGVVGIHVVNGTGQVVLPSGDLLPTAIAAPSVPGAGTAHVYIDSTSKNIAIKNDAGTVNHGAQTQTAAAGKAFTALSDAGAFTETLFQAPLTACTDYVSVSCQGATSDIDHTAGSNSVVHVDALHESGGARRPYGSINASGTALVWDGSAVAGYLPLGDLSNDYTSPTVIAIEADGAMKGDLLATSIATPAAPSAGHVKIYGNTTADNAMMERSNGNVTHMMQTASCGSGQFFSASADDGTFTCAGTVSAAVSANFVTYNPVTTGYGSFVIPYSTNRTTADIQNEAMEVPIGFAAKRQRVMAWVTSNALSSSGGGSSATACESSQNGTGTSVFAGGGGGIPNASTGLFDSGIQTVSSSAATDTWGIICGGSSPLGGTITFTVTVTLYQ